MAAIHREDHPEYVEGCFLCRVGSVSVAPSATPSRNGGAKAVEVNEREARWQRDMPAYKSLRANGLQPRQIDGADRLAATAADRMEVEMGHVFPTKAERERVKEGMVQAQEMGGAA